MVVIAELAAFYEMPCAELIGPRTTVALWPAPPGRRPVLDLAAVRRVGGDGRLAPVRAFVDTICDWRDDRAGRVLSVRDTDWATVALLLGRSRPATIDLLYQAGLLASDTRLVDLVGAPRAELLRCPTPARARPTRKSRS